jgi:predicted  nucleic acid-binding Zn-ribbon protein
VYEVNKGLMDELMNKTKSYKETLSSAVHEVTDIRNRLEENCNIATSRVRSSFDQLRKELEVTSPNVTHN